MISKIKHLFTHEEGAETLEYVAIVAVVIIIGAAAYNAGIGQVITAALQSITDAFSTATSGSPVI